MVEIEVFDYVGILEKTLLKDKNQDKNKYKDQSQDKNQTGDETNDQFK